MRDLWSNAPVQTVQIPLSTQPVVGEFEIGDFRRRAPFPYLFVDRQGTTSDDEMVFSKTHWRPRTAKLILCIFLACCVLFYKSRPVSTSTSQATSQAAEPDDRIVASSSNSTIGFGQIYVISQKDSQRRHSLIQAANVTELRLNIPEQPTWTDNDMDSFKLPQDSTILKGSLLAWLGHIHALRK